MNNILSHRMKQISVLISSVFMIIIVVSFFNGFIYWHKAGSVSIAGFVGNLGETTIYIPFILLLFFPYLYVIVYFLRILMEWRNLLNHRVFYWIISIANNGLILLGFINVSGIFITIILSQFPASGLGLQWFAILFLALTWLIYPYINNKQKLVNNSPYIRIIGHHLKLCYLSLFLGIGFFLLILGYTPTLIPSTPVEAPVLAPDSGLYLLIIASFGCVAASILEFHVSLRYLHQQMKESNSLK